jgi:predicted phosphodiesterase
MTKKVGLFSDLHGDKQNLDLIVRTLKQLGIDSTLFLGDAIYKTMADFTNTQLTQAHQFRSSLRQDSQIRKDVMDGLFSNKQLEEIVNNHELGTKTGKKIAKLEYQDLSSALAGLDYAVLGGNWDYREEMQEVFGDDLLNSTSKDLSGINVLGFTGGGSPAVQTAMTETFADNEDEQGLMYQKWTEKLRSPEPLNADILISHVPFTDGEGVKKENPIEHLKSLVLRRKQARLDVPEVLVNGHRHSGAAIKYDEEMDAFLMSPGCSSKNHNNGTPTFLVAEFDEEKKLVGAQQYSILASIKGASEVRLSGQYTLDRENKKVDFEEKNQVVLQDYNPKVFADNLSLDDNIRLTQRGFNTDYDPFKETPQELDLLVRKNIQVMFNETEQVSKEVQAITTSVAKEYVSNGNTDIEEAIFRVEEELAKLACQRTGGDYETLSQSELAKPIFRTMISTILGVDYNMFFNSLRDNSLSSLSDTASWGSDVASGCSNTLSQQLQKEIFTDLESEELQAMAECHLPAAYERVKELDRTKAWNLWVNTYKQGFLTSDAVEATGAYKKKEGFDYHKRTKEDIAERFGFNDVQELTDNLPSETDTISNLPNEEQEQIRADFRTGDVPVLSEPEGKEYVPLMDGRKLYLDNGFKSQLQEEGIAYTTKTQEEFEQESTNRIAADIREGRRTVLEKDGREYIRIGDNQVLPFNRERLGLGEQDYQARPLQGELVPAGRPPTSNPPGTL